MHSSGKTDTGIKRNNNQDSIFFSDTPVGPLPNLYIVADGMGGHRAGDKASRMAIDITVDFIEKSTIENPVALLKRAMLFVNNEIYKAACADPDLNGMGTTMVAAVAQDGKLYVANVGDSRLYAIGGEIRQKPLHSWSGISCAIDSCSHGNEEAESKGKWRTGRKRKYKTDRDRWYPLWLCVVFRNESATEWYRGISGRRGQLRQIGVSHRNVCGYGCNRIRITREEIT